VAGFISERWPASNRYAWPECVGIRTLDHDLGDVLPLGRKMTRPTAVSMTDRSGTKHECVAEAFDTTQRHHAFCIRCARFPPFEPFRDAESYYATLAHELAH
jgi:hypothetical protein